MDGFTRAIGDGISGLVGGSLHAIGSALDGMVSVLGAALPPGAQPVIGVVVALLFFWAVIKR
jgi:hypothetical protein